MTEIKDIADLFVAVEESEAMSRIETRMEVAEDALALAIKDAPNTDREKLAHTKMKIIPVVMKLSDPDERRAALDDVSKALKINKKPLKNALAAAEVRERQRVEEEQIASAESDEENDLAPAEGTIRHERAMELLREDDILAAAAHAMERLGHVGEYRNKRLAFVSAVSARAGFPIQPSTHAESSTGKNFLWDVVLSLFPIEMVIRRSAISAKALFRTEENLKGAVLYLQEMVGSEEADFTLRVLQSSGELIYEVTERDANGQFYTAVHRKAGPCVIIQTSTRETLFSENATRVIAIYLDESKEQTQRILEHAFRTAESGGMDEEERLRITEPWQDAVRLLEPAPVKIPFASRISMPLHLVRSRRDANQLLNVIRVLAFIHQHARKRDEDGAIVAEEWDFHKAVDLVSESLGRAWKSLSPAQEKVFKRIQELSAAKKRNGFRRSDLHIPDMPARRVQNVLKALMDAGHLDSDGRKGPQGLRYTVLSGESATVTGIRLRGKDEPEIEDHDESAENETPAGSSESEASQDADEPEGDALDVLTDLGWYRFETAKDAAAPLMESAELARDPIAQILRDVVPIYITESKNNLQILMEPSLGNDCPVALTLGDIRGKLLGAHKPDDVPYAFGNRDLSDRIRMIVRSLQDGTHEFRSPASEAYREIANTSGSGSSKKLYKEAMLVAEEWTREYSEDSIWVLVAVKEEQYLPDDLMSKVLINRIRKMEAF